MREDVGHLEVDISDFTACGQTSKGSGRSPGQSVCHSENGTYSEEVEGGGGAGINALNAEKKNM